MRTYTINGETTRVHEVKKGSVDRLLKTLGEVMLCITSITVSWVIPISAGVWLMGLCPWPGFLLGMVWLTITALPACLFLMWLLGNTMLMVYEAIYPQLPRKAWQN